MAASRKRTIDPGDAETAAKRTDVRRDIDDAIRLALMPLSQSWIYIQPGGAFKDKYCSEFVCAFDRPERRCAFRGYYESLYARGARSGRVCDACFAGCHDTARLAFTMREYCSTGESVENLLLEESQEDVYASETNEEALERALSTRQWRHMTPPMKCFMCGYPERPAVRCRPDNPQIALCANAHTEDGTSLINSINAGVYVPVARFQACVMCAATTPATHLLVGRPGVRVCDVHYAGRAGLREHFFPAGPPVAK